jgi:hypothetical protein
MAAQPPLDFTALATRLVNSCAEKNFISMAEVLAYLAPSHYPAALAVAAGEPGEDRKYHGTQRIAQITAPDTGSRR